MRTRSTTLFVALALLWSSPVFAHGDEKHGEAKHVMGTVSSVDAEHLILKDRAGKIVSIKLNKETKYFVGEAAAPASDVKIGDRVVVDVTGKEGSFTATQVRLGKKPAQGHQEAGGHQ
jgi:hypothetical protein